MNQVREIKATAIYSEDELSRLVLGLTTIDELKTNCGLVGSFETGFWGRNAIAAIDRLIEGRQAPGGKKR